MRNLLFVAILFSSPLWAHDGSSKPSKSSKKKKAAVCEAIVAENSDDLALQARAISTLVPMGSMRHYIQEISGLRPLPSGFVLKMRRTDGERAIARMLLKERAESMGYAVKMEDYGKGTNLIVELPGKSLNHEVIEVTAHYDSIMTGADDNGSGVALMLGMLDMFRNTEHERRIRIVFMDQEERGFRGSRNHAEKIRRTKTDGELVGVLVVDTIGWAHEKSKMFLGVLEVGENWQAAETYDKRITFAREGMYAIARGGATEGLIISPETFAAMPGTSDMGSYWKKELPAVLFAAAFEDGFVNPDYHKIGDTLANMNWHYYQRMSQAAVQMVAYTSRMRMKDPSVINERGWAVLREQENKTIKLEQYKLPEHADRSLALDGMYQKEGTPSKPEPKQTQSFTSGPMNSIGVTWKSSTSSIAQNLNAIASADSSSELYDEHPLYVARFVQTIEKSSPSELFMFLLSPKYDGDSLDSELINRGFVVADNQVLDLVGDSDEVYQIIKTKVVKGGGKIFNIRPISSEHLSAGPKDIWPAIKTGFLLHAQTHTQFMIVTGYLGNYHMTLMPSLLSTPATAPKVKPQPLPEKPPLQLMPKLAPAPAPALPPPTGPINTDDSIWKDFPADSQIQMQAPVPAPAQVQPKAKVPPAVTTQVHTLPVVARAIPLPYYFSKMALTPPNELFLLLYESSDSKKRGFITTPDPILDLENATETDIRVLTAEVRRRGGRVYTFVSAISQSLGSNLPPGGTNSLWLAMKKEFMTKYTEDKFTLDPTFLGRFVVTQVKEEIKPALHPSFLPDWVRYYGDRINAAKSNEVFFFSFANSDHENRGFVVANNEIHVLLRVTNEEFAAVREMVRVRGGKIYSFTSSTAERLKIPYMPATPEGIWNQIKDDFLEKPADAVKFTVDTELIGTFEFTLLSAKNPTNRVLEPTVKTVDATEGDKLHLFVFPDGNSKYHGFIVANDQVIPLAQVSDSEKIYGALKAKIQTKGGKLFQLAPRSDSGKGADPRDIWIAIGYLYLGNASQQRGFTIGTAGNLGLFDLDPIFIAAAPSPVSATSVSNDSIWKD